MVQNIFNSKAGPKKILIQIKRKQFTLKRQFIK